MLVTGSEYIPAQMQRKVHKAMERFNSQHSEQAAGVATPAQNEDDRMEVVTRRSGSPADD